MPTSSPENNRQNLSASNPEEFDRRQDESKALIEELIGEDARMFQNPRLRLELIGDQTSDEFYRMTQHINRRLRGIDGTEIRNTPLDRGAQLGLLHTPSAADKPAAFTEGYKAIKEYIADTQDDIGEQAQAVGMATEALIVLVHPFDDGNGRTSRFLGEFIENGTNDIDALTDATASSVHRLRDYPKKHCLWTHPHP